MNFETSIELKKMATTREEPRTIESVIGKKIINSPITPGQKPKGRNAATVVAVEIIIGYAISPIPFFAASMEFILSFSINLYAFSTTTIPLSTSIPRPMMRPKRTIVLIVSPKKPITTKDISIDIGIAKPTNNAFLKPRKNISTVITNITPKTMLLAKSETRFFVISD